MSVDWNADSIRINNQSAISNQQSTISLMRDGIVDDVNGLGRRLRGQSARQRLGQRDFQDLVHRLDHVDVQRVQYVLGNVRQVFLVVFRQDDILQAGAVRG